MKIFNRILFALVAAMGLYLVMDLSNERVVKDYINEVGTEALENSDYDFFVSARYYHQTPLYDDTFEFDAYSFLIKIYNVANIIETTDGFEVVEGFQIILHQTDGPTLEPPFAGRIITDDNDTVIEYIGLKISDLPAYTFVTGIPRATFFNASLFMTESTYHIPQSLDIVQGDTVLGSYTLLIEETDYQLKPLLESYINTHNDVPTETFDEVGYSAVIDIDSSALVIRNAIIYVFIIAIITVLLFVVQKKHMGRKKATEGLQKDVEKLYHKDEERR
ncbi:MAG: hypothetical protein ACNA7K_03540 [Acholeplasmataceae bacterium]